MTRLADMSLEELRALERELEREFSLQQGNRLSLDLTRGKPAPDQLELSAGLETAINGNYKASDGTDTRNYGGLRGIPEARSLGAEILDVSAEQVICWGNSSLGLMYLCAELAMNSGLWGDERRWRNHPAPKILTPVPGYDRHFTLSANLGLEMVNVPMDDAGPDMASIEALVRDDASIKGIWCVPKFSNPTGCSYSDERVTALARLPSLAAADDFVVFWDNAYAVHDFEFPRAPLAAIGALAEKAGTSDHVLQFASTSKITLASGGIAFLAGSEPVLRVIEQRLNVSSVGPDKVNQLRHARFLHQRLEAHMAEHARLLKPKFDLVQRVLTEELAELDIATWTVPGGGYFVSLDTRPGLAKKVGELAKSTGLSLTPAGATYPHGRDPNDSNLRIAPSFATLPDLMTAMEVFVLCLKLASARAEIATKSTHRSST
ncbi:MAG: aminotransferase class I/II-fold pyridoxal phosphate-dependent enzyme [Pseudomonadales bacterium]|nr:aminotransferase class I/II-fold pyridoxal phosphate-dependent enzyme [Pseudomonadales bacterium]